MQSAPPYPNQPGIDRIFSFGTCFDECTEKTPNARKAFSLLLAAYFSGRLDDNFRVG